MAKYNAEVLRNIDDIEASIKIIKLELGKSVTNVDVIGKVSKSIQESSTKISNASILVEP